MRKAFALSLSLHGAVILAFGLWICPWLERRAEDSSRLARGVIDLFVIATQAEATQVEPGRRKTRQDAVPRSRPRPLSPSPPSSPVSAIDKSTGESTADEILAQTGDTLGETQTFTLNQYMRWVVSRNAAPAYPRIAQIRGEEGRVLIRVTVDSVGRLAEAPALEQSSGSALLDKLSLEAVQSWNFPAFMGKRAPLPRISFLIPFRFSLEDKI